MLLPALAWAQVPPYYLALLHFYRAIERKSSPLDPALRSIVQTRISQLTHCAFCIDLNSQLAAERAGSMDKVLALDGWRDSALFSAKEKAALAWAEAITRSEATDDLARELRQHFPEAEVIELTGLAAFQNMSARFNAALDLPSQGLCRAPQSKI